MFWYWCRDAPYKTVFWDNPTYEEVEIDAIPYGETTPVRATVFALRRPDKVPAYLYPSQRYKMQ